jgi:hypothetical protein
MFNPAGRFAGIDWGRKISGLNLAIDGWLGVFKAPRFEIVPAEQLYWRLPIIRIHYEFLAIPTRYVASQGTNGPNEEANHMQEIGFLPLISLPLAFPANGDLRR